jgi:hypothetical protein
VGLEAVELWEFRYGPTGLGLVESMDLVKEPSWTPVGQGTSSSDGIQGLIIAPGVSSGTRFYRVIWVR